MSENPYANYPAIDLSDTCLEPGCLDGEVAVVTGSTSNVGMGFARALAWAGANVVVTGRNEARGNGVVDLITRDSGEGKAIFVKADVSVDADIQNLADKALETYGKVDILLNNAMNLALNGTILGSSIEDLDASYALSARASMLTAKAFVPGMIERGHGTVSFSTTQFNYMPPMIGGSIYTAGKSAGTSVLMSLANEVNGTGVNVFGFCPAGVGGIAEGSVENPDEVKFQMPGFPDFIPANASGAAMVYSILNGEKLHGSAFIVSEALSAMNYPFPIPETAGHYEDVPRIEDPMGVTMIFCSLGKGFYK